MINRSGKMRLFYAMAVSLVGCVSKEYTSLGPDQPDWLKTGSEAAALATEVEQPEIRPRTYYAAGQLFEQQGEIRKAVIQYRKTIAVDEEHVAAHSRLGVLLGRLGLHTEAEQALSRAIELRPDWAFLRNNLGFAYMRQECWKEAEVVLREAINLKPSFARAHNNLAIVLFKMGRVEEALNEFRKAVPEADAYYNLGLLFRGERRYRDATDAFERALALAPHFEAARIQLERLSPRLQPEAGVLPSAEMGDWENVVLTEAPVKPQDTSTAIVAETPTDDVPATENDALAADALATSAEEEELTVTQEDDVAADDDFIDRRVAAERPCADEQVSDAVDEPIESYADGFEEMDDAVDTTDPTADAVAARPATRPPDLAHEELDPVVDVPSDTLVIFAEPVDVATHGVSGVSSAADPAEEPIEGYAQGSGEFILGLEAPSAAGRYEATPAPGIDLAPHLPLPLARDTIVATEVEIVELDELAPVTPREVPKLVDEIDPLPMVPLDD